MVASTVTTLRTGPKRAYTRSRNYVRKYRKVYKPWKKGYIRSRFFPNRMYGRSPIPVSYRCTMDYVETYYASSGVGGVFGTEAIFSLNSLYDPNYGGVGHQPYGFDQLSALYRRYIVYGCLVEVEANDPSADGVVIGYTAQGTNSVATLAAHTIDEVKERSMCYTRSVNNTGRQNVYFKRYYSIPRLEGLPISQYNIDDFGALCTTGPSKLSIFRVAIAGEHGVEGLTCNIRVRLRFKCKFYDRITQGQS